MLALRSIRAAGFSSRLMAGVVIAASILLAPAGVRAAWQAGRNGPYPIIKSRVAITNGGVGSDKPGCQKATGFRCNGPALGSRGSKRKLPPPTGTSRGSRTSCHKATAFRCNGAHHPGRPMRR